MKNVTVYIATMKSAEARAAAYDIHAQWFDWGNKMSNDLVSPIFYGIDKLLYEWYKFENDVARCPTL